MWLAFLGVVCAAAPPYALVQASGDTRFAAAADIVAVRVGGGLVYTEDRRGTVIAWSKDGEIRWFATVSPAPTPTLTVSPDGTQVAAGTDSLHLWDAATGTELWAIPYGTMLPGQALPAQWTDDGARLLLRSRLEDRELALAFDPSAGPLLPPSASAPPRVLPLRQFSADGQHWLALEAHLSVPPPALTHSQSRLAVVVGAERDELEPCEVFPANVEVRGTRVIAVGWHLCIWDLDQRQLLHDRVLPDRAQAVQIGPDGRTALVVDASSVTAYDLVNARRLWVDRALGGPVELRYSPDGSWVVVAGGTTTRVLHIADGSVVQVLPEADTADQVAFLADEIVFAAGSALSLASGGPIAGLARSRRGVVSLHLPSRVYLHTDGETTLLARMAPNSLRAASLVAGHLYLERTPPSLLGVVGGGGGALVVQQTDGLHLWTDRRSRPLSLETKSARVSADRRWIYAAEPEAVAAYRPRQQHPSARYSTGAPPTLFAPRADGDRLAVADGMGKLAVWSTKTKEVLWGRQLQHVTQLAWDSHRLIAATGTHVAVYRGDDGALLQVIDLPAPLDRPTSLLVHDGTLWVGTQRGQVLAFRP